MISIYECYPSRKIQSLQLLLSPPSRHTGSVIKFSGFYFSHLCESHMHYAKWKKPLSKIYIGWFQLHKILEKAKL